ncbi:MAG: hypothetical protein R3253_07910, partial [Longimicrobiales bacterium]|nr:hypothetical protein [Longimicrobiales bacterium]
MRALTSVPTLSTLLRVASAHGPAAALTLTAALALPADSSIIEGGPQAAGYFFYQGRPYGTDAVTGPVDVVLNKGFAVAQFNNRNRYIFDYDYGTRHVWNSIRHFRENVRRYGG